MTLAVGCGDETSEFVSPNGQFSIQAGASWSAQDAGEDNILAIYSKDERKGILIYQYVKEDLMFPMKELTAQPVNLHTKLRR